MMLSLLSLPVLAGVGVIAHGVFVPGSGVFCRTMSRLATSADEVALTFDDGPWPGGTDVILDTLAERGVCATFFVIGRHAASHPEMVRRMAADGHLVGNHTYDHHRWGLFRGFGYWRRQVARTDDVLRELTGDPVRYFRAPMGLKAPTLAHAARSGGHTVVAWSRRTLDGGPASPEGVVRAAARARAGDILLLHDGRDAAARRRPPASVTALPRVLDVLEAKGLRPVRLDAFAL